MKGERILCALTGVREDYIEQAYPPEIKTGRVWVKYAACAACLCAVLAGALAAGRGPAALPVIDIPDFATSGAGFGVYDLTASETDNPWREDMELETLPVFKNGFFDPCMAGEPRGLSEREMRKRLERAARALGQEILETRTTRDSRPSGVALYITAQTDGGDLMSEADGTLCWYADDDGPGVALPEEYAFSEAEATEARERERIKYLAGRYSELLGFEQPETVMEDFGYIYRGTYDAAGDSVQDILNYNFEQASFSLSEDGKYLRWLRVENKLSAMEKIGDYPVISVEGARERLLSGQYQTISPLPVPGAEYILSVELVYRSTPLEEILLPYYLFSVELLPDGDYLGYGERGLGWFYVPAIEEQYIGNMKSGNMLFN